MGLALLHQELLAIFCLNYLSQLIDSFFFSFQVNIDSVKRRITVRNILNTKEFSKLLYQQSK